jgi:DNA-binding response OmpR family regulator
MLEDTSVLVVEDDEGLAEMFATWLQKEGASIATVQDGEQALNQWTAAIDIVVLDRRLPSMYGKQILHKARKQGFETPVLMVTAVKPDLDMIDMSFDEYILKPVDQSELLDAIKRIHPSHGQIRQKVRLFERTSVKLSRLRQRHTDEFLQTHAEYQQLVKEYNDLANAIEDELSQITENEQQTILRATERVQV